MKCHIDWEEHVDDFVGLEPDCAGYPAWCIDCDGQWLVFRPVDALYSEVFIAACSVHREWSPECREDFIRVAKAITAVTPFPEELEQHADSPFV